MLPVCCYSVGSALSDFVPPLVVLHPVSTMPITSVVRRSAGDADQHPRPVLFQGPTPLTKITRAQAPSTVVEGAKPKALARSSSSNLTSVRAVFIKERKDLAKLRHYSDPEGPVQLVPDAPSIYRDLVKDVGHTASNSST